MPEEKQTEITRFIDLKKEFNKFLLLKDDGVLALLVDTIIANQLDGDSVWMFLVAPSSGGKSELLAAFNDVEFGGNKLMFPISDLTTNTFASGQKKVGEETSLLHKMPSGSVMVFKDFTSMLSKNRDARAEILGQMREVYDGEYTKRTGTGKDIVWKGKVGAMAGATEIIYDYQEDFSAMGDRFIMYSMKQPGRQELLKFVMDKEEDPDSNKEEMRIYLKACVKSYVGFILENMVDEGIVLDEETKQNIIDVADFCTLVRSGVIIDKRRGHVEFVPSAEMPTRMIHQLMTIAKAMIVRHKTEPLSGGDKAPHNIGKLTEAEEKILCKVAFDSIPKKRRMALKLLATYPVGITTKGLATSLNYESEVVKGWLSQLNGLGVCRREGKGGPVGDTWVLNRKYHDVVIKFENIKVKEGVLEDDEFSDDDFEEIAKSWNKTPEDLDLPLEN